MERVNRTLQDRLIPVLRHKGIPTIEAANHFLEQTFLREFNDRFTHAPAQPHDAHVPLDKKIDVDRLCSIRHSRTVTNAWTIRFKNHVYQIARTTTTVPLRPASKVEVSERLDGSVHIYYKDVKLAMQDIRKCDIFSVALHPLCYLSTFGNRATPWIGIERPLRWMLLHTSETSITILLWHTASKCIVAIGCGVLACVAASIRSCIGVYQRSIVSNLALVAGGGSPR